MDYLFWWNWYTYSIIIFPPQMTLLRWLTFFLGSQTVILTVLILLIYFIVLTLVFFLQWLSFNWEILPMLLFRFPLTFHHVHSRMSHFITLLMTVLVLIRTVFVIIWEILHGRIYLNSMLVLLLVNFASGFKLELMYISLIEGIRSSFTYLHGFQQNLLLP